MSDWPAGITLCTHPLGPPEGALADARATALGTVHFPAGVQATVLPHVQSFASAVAEATGVTWVSSYPGHDPHITRALDVFVAPASYGADRALGDAVCDFAHDHFDRFGVWYMLFRRRIFNPSVAGHWRGMAGRGGPTADHFDHVHLSFHAEAPDAPPPTPDEEDDMFDADDRARLVGLETRFEELKKGLGRAAGGDGSNWHQFGDQLDARLDRVEESLAELRGRQPLGGPVDVDALVEKVVDQLAERLRD
ncbi:MAG: hypothetical protein ACRD2W_20815 [Acidimicrobiales bacterium]